MIRIMCWWSMFRHECAILEGFGVPDGRVYPNFGFDPGGIVHNTTCLSVGNGSVSVSGVSLSPVGDYDISLYSGVDPLVVGSVVSLRWCWI